MKKKMKPILISDEFRNILLLIKDEKEQEKKIKFLEVLLESLSYCEIDHDLEFVEDDLNDLLAQLSNLNSVQVKLSISARATCSSDKSKSFRYISLYFCFFNDGSFNVIKDCSFSLPNKLAAKVFESHSKDQADSWSEGVEKIIQILNEAYS